jgi:hypothetical protein
MVMDEACRNGIAPALRDGDFLLDNAGSLAIDQAPGDRLGHPRGQWRDAGLKARLAASYRQDQATGCSKGRIRGALTVKRPL